MWVHLLVQKSTQNDSIKGELEEALYVAPEGFTFRRNKICNKM